MGRIKLAKKRMVILAELIFENEYDDDWNFIMKDKPEMVKEAMTSVIEESLRGEARVKIKKYRMEGVKGGK